MELRIREWRGFSGRDRPRCWQWRRRTSAYGNRSEVVAEHRVIDRNSFQHLEHVRIPARGNEAQYVESEEQIYLNVRSIAVVGRLKEYRQPSFDWKSQPEAGAHRRVTRCAEVPDGRRPDLRLEIFLIQALTCYYLFTWQASHELSTSSSYVQLPFAFIHSLSTLSKA